MRIDLMHGSKVSIFIIINLGFAIVIAVVVCASVTAINDY